MAFYQISLESYVIMPNGGGHLGFFINMKNKLSSIVSSFQFVSLRDFKNIFTIGALCSNMFQLCQPSSLSNQPKKSKNFFKRPLQ